MRVCGHSHYERGLVGVTTHQQLGNIAFTHRAAGSEHNEESAEEIFFTFIAGDVELFSQ